ncbi:UPF0182 family protein [Kutzneria viridogrisea]|uniref:UPF0182 protein KALB_1106 n=2 Tax=Kutzneria TaxID=43356 RepID=W5W8C2_9PSEU|nr:UPF0182 family protein [Kutzneria albida]AHH94479.1 UPF0182 protein [Kutzneria albida DSM 43870]MBA8930146.1 hypothetical protein [Kutzneria viridogrisea]
MATRPPVGLPTLSRRSRILIAVGVVVLIGLILSSRLLSTYIDFLWYGEVGFRSVFSTVLLTRVVLFLAVGLVVGGAVALNLQLAYRSRPVFVPLSAPDDPVARYRAVVTRRPKLFGIGIPVLAGFLSAVAAQNDWQQVQLFLNGGSFNQVDPIFKLDVGFFVFQLPFYEWALNWLFIATALSFFAALVTHYVFQAIRLAGRGGQLSGPARIQLCVIAGVFVLFKAVAYFFDRFDLLFSTSNPLANGANYTALNAVMPAKLILLCIAVFCALAFFAGAFLRNLQLPAIATVLLILSSLLIGVAWPAVLQQFSVSPNAKDKESEPISYNISATRQAYGITEDKVSYKPYDNKPTATPDQIKSDAATVGNARLLDPNVLSATFTQFQQGRNFYAFPSKLDIDRYSVNGQTNDYIVAAREVNTGALADSQKNWINQHLVYTHGNGFVAAKANTVNSGGYPEFTTSELAADGKSVTQGAIHVDQPRIYYGELETSADSYAIVGAQNGQAGQEYDTDSSTYTYQGAGGVPLGNWFNRLVFAASYSERNILFNSSIGDDSKILYNRDPKTRVKMSAPWLTVDSDPYPAVVNGKIVWIVDAYTTLANYPYAQQTQLGDVTNDSLTTIANAPRQQNTSISYIRNSVKATVDAYDGSVSLYEVDNNDPVLKAWEKVFPGTVKPTSDISPELRQHFRYPEDLFKVQRDLLAKYHVSNPQDFYSNVSFWNVPADPTLDSSSTQAIQNQSQPQPPYYILSGSQNAASAASFQLTSPLVFQGRDFMSAYVSAASDPGPDYGKLTVLQLPSDTQTPGPKLVQTQFITNNGSQINLLRQQATTLKFGNLLTLPVGKGLLYVEPVYVEQSANQNSSYPQLSRVLVSYNGGIGFAATFAEALNQALTGATPSTPPPNNGQPGSSTPTTTPNSPSGGQLSPDLAKAVSDIETALKNIKSAQSSGDFAALGQAYKALDDATKRFDAAKAAAPTGNQTPTSTSTPPSGG